MKKIYMQPAMLVVKTNVKMNICQVSDPKREGTTTDAISGNLSKRRGIFDSDDAESSNGIW